MVNPERLIFLKKNCEKNWFLYAIVVRRPLTSVFNKSLDLKSANILAPVEEEKFWHWKGDYACRFIEKLQFERFKFI